MTKPGFRFLRLDLARHENMYFRILVFKKKARIMTLDFLWLVHMEESMFGAPHWFITSVEVLFAIEFLLVQVYLIWHLIRALFFH